jgi:hypothetical protein
MDLPLLPDQSFPQFNQSLMTYTPTDFVNTDHIGCNFWYSTVSQKDRLVEDVNSATIYEVPQLYNANMTMTEVINTSDVAMRTTSFFLTPFDGDIYENVISSDSLESAPSSYSSITDICSPEIPPSKHFSPPAHHIREFRSPPPSNAIRPTAFTANTDKHDSPIVSSSNGRLSPDASTELTVPKHPCLEYKEYPQGFLSDHELQKHINLRHMTKRKKFKYADLR